jgi:hypothetical protein
MIKIIPGYSNWEIVLLIIINKVTIGKNRRFNRSDIITSDNIKFAETLTSALGHKEKPEHPEETIQRTMQNLRDKGYVYFLGGGEYRLTDDGIEATEAMGQRYSYDSIMKGI